MRALYSEEDRDRRGDTVGPDEAGGADGRRRVELGAYVAQMADAEGFCYIG